MYKVVCVQKPTFFGAVLELENQVNKLKNEGYSIQGGVSISFINEIAPQCIVCQAMVKNEE